MGNDALPQATVVVFIFLLAIAGVFELSQKVTIRAEKESVVNNRLDSLEENFKTLDLKVSVLDNKISTVKEQPTTTQIIREEISNDVILKLKEDITATVIKALPKQENEMIIYADNDASIPAKKSEYICIFSAEQQCWKEN